LICKLEARRKGVDDPIGSNASKKAACAPDMTFPTTGDLSISPHRDRRSAASAKAYCGERRVGD